jgi:hypothetical protein
MIKPKRFSYDEITDEMVDTVSKMVGFKPRAWCLAPADDIVAESINVAIASGLVVFLPIVDEKGDELITKNGEWFGERRGGVMHTPGPWKIFDGWGASRCAPVVVDSIPDIDGKCVANCICHVASSNDNAEANARLIAASPGMLEALEDILCGWRYIRQNPLHKAIYGVGWDRAQEKAEAAIRKAKEGTE